MFFSIRIDWGFKRGSITAIKLVHEDVRIGIVKYRGSWLLHIDIFCASIMMHNITIAL